MADVNQDKLADAVRLQSDAKEAGLALQAAVGERIRDVRESLDYGQAEVARGAGIDTSSMFRIEKGEQNLTVHTLARLALAMGISMDQLLIGVQADPAIVEPRTRLKAKPNKADPG